MENMHEIRGNERKNILISDEDKQQFIEMLIEKKQENRFYLNAFCLMDNHIHLMISEGTEDVTEAMKRITIGYVYYFNKKYKRVDHLFQDRRRKHEVNGSVDKRVQSKNQPVNQKDCRNCRFEQG